MLRVDRPAPGAPHALNFEVNELPCSAIKLCELPVAQVFNFLFSISDSFRYRRKEDRTREKPKRESLMTLLAVKNQYEKQSLLITNHQSEQSENGWAGRWSRKMKTWNILYYGSLRIRKVKKVRHDYFWNIWDVPSHTQWYISTIWITRSSWMNDIGHEQSTAEKMDFAPTSPNFNV